MEKRKHKKQLITTSGKNNYLFSQNFQQFLLLHPVLNFLLKLVNEGTSLEEWFKHLSNDPLEIESGVTVTTEELQSYYRYLLFLDKNNYFKDAKENGLSENRYTAESVKYHLANTQQIVFEVTEGCDLKCKYCGYGDLYNDYDKRENKSLNLKLAKQFLDYMLDLLKSPLNRRLHKRIAISFYGGEPLLNMPAIKEIVQYVRDRALPRQDFFFSMTTNAVKLDKHMNFLVDNNFLLLFSLDGNQQNSGYRVFPNGASSFDIVFRNILKLKEKYPAYFETSVNFMAVLHDKNSDQELNAFFQKHFGKKPLISQVNPLGINPQKKDEFNAIFKQRYTEVKSQDIKEDIQEREKILNAPVTKPLAKFLHRNCGFVFKKYDRLLVKRDHVKHVLTGTCNPFEKKVFLTASGKILPCERILQEYTMGSIDETGIHIDFKKIAHQYNQYYKKLKPMCDRCSNSDGCGMCIFCLDLNEDTPSCDRFKND